MQIIKELDQVKRLSIRISNETIFIHPISKKEKTFNPEAFSPAYMKRYAIEGNIISFIDENGQWYTIPNLDGVLDTLISEGYIRAGFNVPGGDGSWPKHNTNLWEGLKQLCA